MLEHQIIFYRETDQESSIRSVSIILLIREKVTYESLSQLKLLSIN
jgi:hypothetical protein